MRDQTRGPATNPVAATTVCVIGAGYVGLTAAACLAELGHEVRCVESDPLRLAALTRGEIPIYEPGIEELVARHTGSGRLTFTADTAVAMDGVAVAMLCVGTPPRSDGEPDLRQLGRAATEVAACATTNVALVVKSTVPPGTCEALELFVGGQAREGVRVRVVSNPEFLREGRAVWDFFNPDRVVVGADDPNLGQLVADLYPSDWPLIECSRRSAELVKYASNTFLAVKISFANEVAALCEALGAETDKVLGGVGLDARIGQAFLAPGPGFGGSCLPKDLSGFIAVAESAGRPAEVARAAQRANDAAQVSVIAKVESALGSLPGRTVTVLGLAFKAGTDDTRFSPALALVRGLALRGARVRVHDPIATVSDPAVCQLDTPYDAAQGSDALIVATGWPEYHDLDPTKLRAVMVGHVIVDAVGVTAIEPLHDVGFDVYGVGRGLATSFAPVLWRPLEWMLDAGQPSTIAARER
ncbi:MAG: UDP-glucose/GDP-mannose dehydrogenase family protein [Actinomycetales bacterium]|nr:UDP-glucose/GDP-mannose dehydrogenase family protein [Actinomycetales bacterium]